MRQTMLMLCAAGAVFCAAPAAMADAQSDAAYIVEQTVTPEMLAGAVQAVRPMIQSALQHDFNQKGITLSDPARFFDIIMEEFTEGYITRMRKDMIELQTATFSPDELAGIAAFYASDAGQAMLKNAPHLMQQGAAIGQRNGAAAGFEARFRVGERLKAEGITVTQDPAMMDKLLDTLTK